VKTHQLADLIVKIRDILHSENSFIILLTTSDQG
jgi:hypothetical protein